MCGLFFKGIRRLFTPPEKFLVVVPSLRMTHVGSGQGWLMVKVASIYLVLFFFQNEPDFVIKPSSVTPPLDAAKWPLLLKVSSTV